MTSDSIMSSCNLNIFSLSAYLNDSFMNETDLVLGFNSLIPLFHKNASRSGACSWQGELEPFA